MLLTELLKYLIIIKYRLCKVYCLYFKQQFFMNIKINVEQLSEIEIFNGICEDTVKKILDESYIQEYKDGDILFQDKEQVNIIYIVLSGIVSLYKINECGQKKVIFMLSTGKIINDVIVQDLPSSINCDIFETSIIMEVPKEKFVEIMQMDFDFCKNVIKSLTSKTRRLYRQLKNTPTSIKMEKRLAAKLYRLAKDYGIKCDEGIQINMDISITYLADLLGSQRETVSRAMKILQKNEIVIYKNKKIIISNFDKLTHFFKMS